MPTFTRETIDEIQTSPEIRTDCNQCTSPTTTRDGPLTGETAVCRNCLSSAIEEKLGLPELTLLSEEELKAAQ